MNINKSLNVMFGDKKVGTLATTVNHLVAFEYEDEWIRNGFSISPFSLPLQKGVFMPKSFEPFEGLFGVFSDSLPDGWGRLLVDRRLLKEKINPAEVDAINRLAIEGESCMGALTYRPESRWSYTQSELSLDEIAAECQNRLTLRLTNDYKQVERMFRLMCFNVFSHNRDDHSKNFSFLYNENENRWTLSPAYDLTFSNSIGGEHATTVDGNGKDPGMKELLAVAKNIKLDLGKARSIAYEIKNIVLENLRVRF